MKKRGHFEGDQGACPSENLRNLRHSGGIFE